jgi:Polyketide cyclase / dehydrase and lipid transport
MRHHTVTATFSASADEVFAYLADVDNLPEWATEFARELKHVDGRHKVVKGLGRVLLRAPSRPPIGCDRYVLLGFTSLISFQVITPSVPLAIGLALALLAADLVAWRVVSRLFDRERLVTGHASTERA